LNRFPRFLGLAVFTSGMAALAVEMSASRLLGNVFGTSNLVWANIIGLILVYLTAGYFLGGRWADRHPEPSVFYRIMAWSALTTALVPVISRPVLLAAAGAVEQVDAAVALGSFGAVLVLFSVPITLMGCVSPFAIRLAIQDVRAAGDIAGRLYAVSTLGSILGTFLPVLVTIPAIGTTRTFYVFAGILLAVAWIGLLRTDRRMALVHLWMALAFTALFLLGTQGPIKQSAGQVYERESAYNYIQVLEGDSLYLPCLGETVTGTTRFLRLNEGEGVHSVYSSGSLLTCGTWDYFLAAPYLTAAPAEPSGARSLAVVGLAAGTSARQFTEVYGPIPIEGYEIDPVILDIGREYFDMTEPNLDALAVDGRWGLEHSARRFSVIAVEFFSLVRDRLTPDGVLTINVARLPEDRRLIESLSATLEAVFPYVLVADVPYSLNSILYASMQPLSFENLPAHREALAASGKAHPALLTVLDWVYANRQPTPSGAEVFTDDRAPVEQLTNAMVIRFILTGNLDLLSPE
jgi:predicted membrane-bound spermidine synthase